MQPDKFKRRLQAPKSDARRRGQIALEAARRMFADFGPTEPDGPLREASETDFYAAKRKAAAVLGHRIRPGDLPSDSEVREQLITLSRASAETAVSHQPPRLDEELAAAPDRLADHIDRFTIYKMRLQPLEAVKQNPRWHPEGDALYHSLQVFERAREVRPYDEDFLLAALLHDVGKAIDPTDHVAAGLDSLHSAISERTAWLIAHHMDLLARPDRMLSPKQKKLIDEAEYREDLVLLRDLDEAGRMTGVDVCTIDEALEYLRGLENEEYLRGDGA
jgi:HD domain